MIAHLGMKVVPILDKNANLRGAVAKERQLLGDLVADGVLSLCVVTQQCHAHEVPP